MNEWITLRKGGISLHLSYLETYTNNLYGYDLQIRSQSEFEMRFDLSQNFKTKKKQTNSYDDAKELADGAIAELKMVQLDDNKSIKIITKKLQGLSQKPDTWKLTIHLNRDWSFSVTPEFQGDESLFLKVV